MKLKLKAIVAAVAMAMAGGANAAITNGDGTTGSSLMFEAWNTISGIGMVQNLGQTFQSAMGMGNYTSNLDSASFATLLGSDTSGSALNWHVFSVLQFDQLYSGQGLITSVVTQPGAGFGIGTDLTALSSLLVSQGSTPGSGHVGDIIAALGSNDFGTFSSATAAYAGGALGNGPAYYGNFIGGNSALVGFGTINGFYRYANNTNTFLPEAFAISGSQPVSLSAAGVVTFGAPAAVPIPAAVWLFGSGLLGLVGIGRRRKDA